MKQRLLLPLKMRGFFLLMCGLLMSTMAFSQWPNAQQIAANMTIGWNLGNSLEVPGNETGWGNPRTTQQLIDRVRAAGFNTIRIPCAWDSYANQSNNQISTAWLARVKEVVDYCYRNNMYVIINSHWDGGWLEERPFYWAQQQVNAKHHAYWTQIANYFAGYDHRLLFAGTNEVRADYGNPTTEHIQVQQSYNQTFINAVRATGGNNRQRTLIVQTYNTNIQHGLNHFTLPNDPVSGRIMVEVHYYDPYNFTLDTGSTACQQWNTGNCSWANASYVENLFNQVRQRWVNQGIPVLVGEYGAIKRPNAGSVREASRLDWHRYITEAMKRYGMIPVYWDNGASDFALFNRSNGNITDQAGLNALMTGANSGSGSGGAIANGRYRITARHSGLALDVNAGGTSNGSNVIQWAYGGGTNQQWIVTNLGNGFYRISPAHASSMALDVSGVSSSNGANIQIWSNTGGNNQQWSIIHDGNGFYRIRARHSGKCADVSSFSTQNGANVHQWDCNGTTNQQWSFTLLGSARMDTEDSDELSLSKNAANLTDEDDKMPDLALQEAIDIYPNPSLDGKFSISLPEIKESLTIKVFDSTGKMVYRQSASGQMIEVDSGLKPGLYVVTLYSHSNFITNKKLVVR